VHCTTGEGEPQPILEWPVPPIAGISWLHPPKSRSISVAQGGFRQYSREAGLRETSCRCADLRRCRLTRAFRVLPWQRSLVRTQLPRKIVGNRLHRSLCHKAGQGVYSCAIAAVPFRGRASLVGSQVRHLRRHPKHPDDRTLGHEGAGEGPLRVVRRRGHAGKPGRCTSRRGQMEEGYHVL
jgi:hypothetical protein